MDEPVQSKPAPNSQFRAVFSVVSDFPRWLDGFGEWSCDHQSFFAGPVGGRAKALYYRHKFLGTAAVAPMIFCEAFVPAARRLFHHPLRFPIADAHYAMGFAFLYEATAEQRHLDRAVHFLQELKASRCRGYSEYCWGYPFDWVTRNGTIKEHTPLITSTPYVYEAFLQVFQIDHKREWMVVLESIARHATTDIKGFRVSARASSCSYTPFDKRGVINAATYRAFLLTSASQVLANEQYRAIADRNLEFVLQVQNPDGSWFYAVDGVRDFVDHFHTCFVMKALAKIHSVTGQAGCLDADVSFGPDYMQFLMRKFAEDPELGVGGTPFTQDGGYDSTRDSFEGDNYVAGPCQIFRYRCFQGIGGYVANRAGGVDWIAVMTARMKGWKVRSFPEKRFHHHRTLGTAERGELAALFSYGGKDYYLGGPRSGNCSAFPTGW